MCISLPLVEYQHLNSLAVLWFTRLCNSTVGDLGGWLQGIPLNQVMLPQIVIPKIQRWETRFLWWFTLNPWIRRSMFWIFAHDSCSVGHVKLHNHMVIWIWGRLSSQIVHWIVGCAGAGCFMNFLASFSIQTGLFHYLSSIDPWKWTWNLKITQLKRKLILQTSNFLGSMRIFQGVNLTLRFNYGIRPWGLRFVMILLRSYHCLYLEISRNPQVWSMQIWDISVYRDGHKMGDGFPLDWEMF